MYASLSFPHTIEKTLSMLSPINDKLWIGILVLKFDKIFKMGNADLHDLW